MSGCWHNWWFLFLFIPFSVFHNFYIENIFPHYEVIYRKILNWRSFILVLFKTFHFVFLTRIIFVWNYYKNKCLPQTPVLKNTEDNNLKTEISLSDPFYFYCLVNPSRNILCIHKCVYILTHKWNHKYHWLTTYFLFTHGPEDCWSSADILPTSWTPLSSYDYWCQAL